MQIGLALTDAIDIYGDSSGVSFDTGPPVIGSVVSVIPAFIGGVAGAGAPIGAITLARWLKLSAAVQLLTGLYLAIAGGAAAGAIIPEFAAEGTALGAGVGTVAGIVSLTSYQMQTNLEDTD